MLGPGLIYHLAGEPPKDLEATQQRMAMFSAAYSDIHHSIEDLIAKVDLNNQSSNGGAARLDLAQLHDRCMR